MAREVGAPLPSCRSNAALWAGSSGLTPIMTDWLSWSPDRSSARCAWNLLCRVGRRRAGHVGLKVLCLNSGRVSAAAL